MVTRSDNDHGAMSEHRCDAGVEPTSRYQAVKRERLEQEGIGDKQKVITRMKGLDGRVDHRAWGTGTTPWHWTADYVEES